VRIVVPEEYRGGRFGLIGAAIGLTTAVGPPLVVGLAFVGLGIGMAMPGLQSTVVESVREEEVGVASGIYSTSRYLGSIVGSAILAGLLSADRSNTDGLSRVFVIMLIAAILATGVGLGLRVRPEVQGVD
jgi:MFS family permease